MRVFSAIYFFFVLQFSNSKIRFGNNVVQASVSHITRLKRDASEGDSPREPDPNLALEGNCIVVCDANIDGLNSQFKAGSKSTPSDSSRFKSRDSFRKTPGPMGSATSFWDRMSSSACGGTVGSARRERRVAFSVKRSTELATANTALNGGTTVTFDHVMVNAGNAFDMESSNFVAPVNGVYSISFQIYRLYNKNPLTIDLHVNGRMVLRGFADGDSANHKAAHNSGLLRLNARDRVSVQVSSGNLESGWKYSTFSGHLLFENED
ncbi:cerebellin-1-like [Styela clava]|uniref:cerebellin-1-like n=1 Tax=Styela clava TaxID=7725 RepID=UPI00193A433D|nr:cerebellin-1-like [Styela clava]